MDKEHNIEINRVPCRCGTFGHTDLTVTCSCGYSAQLLHGKITDVDAVVYQHKISVITELVGLKFNLEFKPGAY